LDDLKAVGPVQAFIHLREEGSIKPSLNFLYAMVGAIEKSSGDTIHNYLTTGRVMYYVLGTSVCIMSSELPSREPSLEVYTALDSETCHAQSFGLSPCDVYGVNGQLE
jgi:predicted transcriptional regulator